MDRGLAQAIYTLLDKVLTGGRIPPGAKGSIYRVIDHGGCGAEMELARQISVEIHRLDVATLSRDDAECKQARKRLKKLAARCVQARLDVTSTRTTEVLTRKHPLSGLGYYTA